MKNKLLRSRIGIIIFLFTNIVAFAQWQTHGPDGGPQYALTKFGGNVFAGNNNGVFISTDDGQTWSPANNTIERKPVSVLTTNGSGVFVALYGSGVYFSSDNGTTWTAKNNGLTNFNIVSFFSSDSQLFLGTPDGVFFSSDNGGSWSHANAGIPATYTVYSFAQAGSTIFAGTYGLGLYWTVDNGATWTSAAGGFPASSFVYALITNGSTILAGTSAGVYKSTDNGATWISSNTGFPPSMWANTFAVKPGYVFAGTYSEGIFVSTDNGDTWTQKNNGTPDLPFPTGLPHNYPSMQSLVTSGANVIAASVNGMYLSFDNGNNWSEADGGILATDIMAISANSSTVFAGTARTGVFTSPDNGNTWTRSNNGLTSYDVMALTTNSTSVFVSVSNEKVFRSDNNGVTWVSAASGITSDVAVLKSDPSRVLALTTGAQFTPRAVFQTIDNGVHWTEIPTSSLSIAMSALASTASSIYVGTDLGKLYYTADNGMNWLDISGSLPSVQINSILIAGSDLLVGTNGQGVYKSSDNGTTWMTANSGITNMTINDIQQQNGTIYAATWGGGVFVSNDNGTTWMAFNTGLADFFVRRLASEGIKLYAGTDAGSYSSPLAPTSINEKEQTNIKIYPNPSSGIIHYSALANQKVNITINNLSGELIYHYEGNSADNETIDLSAQAKGIYFLNLQTAKEIIRKKIVIQ